MSNSKNKVLQKHKSKYNNLSYGGGTGNGHAEHSCVLRSLLIVNRKYFLAVSRSAWDQRSCEAPKIVAAPCLTRKIAKSSPAEGGGKEVTRLRRKLSRDYLRSWLEIVISRSMTILGSWQSGKSANQRVYGLENDRCRGPDTRHSTRSVGRGRTCEGRELTCKCLVARERNAECHFRTTEAHLHRREHSLLFTIPVAQRLRSRCEMTRRSRRVVFRSNYFQVVTLRGYRRRVGT